MFLEDCTYCGRPATFKLNGLDRVDNNLHYVPADNGVMLQQLYQAESGRAHLPAALSPVPSEHRALTAGTIDRSGLPIPGRLSRSRRLSRGQAPRNTRTRHSSRLTTSCASTVGSAGGIDRYDACTGSVYVIGNMVPCCRQLHEGKAAWRRLLGTVCVSPHGHMHRVDEEGSCDTGSQPVASCDVKHP
jgi:hypothetical protein